MTGHPMSGPRRLLAQTQGESTARNISTFYSPERCTQVFHMSCTGHRWRGRWTGHEVGVIYSSNYFLYRPLQQRQQTAGFTVMPNRSHVFDDFDEKVSVAASSTSFVDPED